MPTLADGASTVLDVICVFFDGDRLQVPLFATGLSKFLHVETLGTIHLVYNGTDPLSEDARQECVAAFGRLAGKVTVTTQSDHVPKPRKPDWWTQQVLKLEAAAASPADHAVVLDTKNVFSKPVDNSFFLAPDGRAWCNFRDYRGHPMADWLTASLSLFGLNADLARSFPQTVTPFVMRPAEVRALRDRLAERAITLAQAIDVQKASEFLLYSAHLRSRYGSFKDHLADRGVSPDYTIWPSGVDPATLAGVLSSFDARPEGIFSVHREAMRRMPEDVQEIVTAFWAERGLFPSHEAARAFLRIAFRPVQMNRIAVIIVNYRTAALTVEAVESLACQPGGDAIDIHIVDNASSEPDVALLKTIAHRTDVRVTLHPQATNMGFGAANNVAIDFLAKRETPPEYVLLLNPDAMVRTDVVGQLSRFLDDTPRAGFAGPLIRHRGSGALREAAFRFPHAGTVFQRAVNSARFYAALPHWRIGIPSGPGPARVDWVSGACVMARFSALRDCGGFDEGFFLYWEEVDLMHRAAGLGWETWHVPLAEVMHVEGVSTGQSTIHGKRMDHPAAYYESWQRYFRKSRGRPYTVFAALVWIAGTWLYYTRCRITRTPPDGAPVHAVRNIARHVLLPTLRVGRSRD